MLRGRGEDEHIQWRKHTDQAIDMYYHSEECNVSLNDLQV